MGLLVLKEKLRQFYGKYSIYIISILKFIIGTTVFYLINSNIGFMARLSNPLIPLILGLVASFLPYGLTAWIAGCLILAHAFQVSIEVALIIALFMLLVMKHEKYR